MFLSRLRLPLSRLSTYHQPYTYQIIKNGTDNCCWKPVAFFCKDTKDDETKTVKPKSTTKPDKGAEKADAGKKHIPFPCKPGKDSQSVKAKNDENEFAGKKDVRCEEEKVSQTGKVKASPGKKHIPFPCEEGKDSQPVQAKNDENEFAGKKDVRCEEEKVSQTGKVKASPGKKHIPFPCEEGKDSQAVEAKNDKNEFAGKKDVRCEEEKVSQTGKVKAIPGKKHIPFPCEEGKDSQPVEAKTDKNGVTGKKDVRGEEEEDSQTGKVKASPGKKHIPFPCKEEKDSEAVNAKTDEETDDSAGKKYIPIPCEEEDSETERKIGEKAVAGEKDKPLADEEEKDEDAELDKKEICKEGEVSDDCREARTPEEMAAVQFAAFRKLQELYQVDDGKPIFLKMGQTDEILFKVTVGLSLIGILGVLHLVIKLL